MLDSGGLATCEPLRKLAALSMDSDGLATCESLQSIGYVAAGCRGVPWRARSTPRGNPRFPSMGFEMRDSQDSGWPPAPDSTSQSASLTAPLSGEPMAACVICGIQIPWNKCGRCYRPGCRVPGGACPVPCSARCAGNGAGTGRRRSWSWRRGFRCGRR